MSLSSAGRPTTAVRPTTGYRPGSALKQQVYRPITQAGRPGTQAVGRPGTQAGARLATAVRPSSARPGSGGRPGSARPMSGGESEIFLIYLKVYFQVQFFI